jgi:glycosyltransferase involved in cell wall biosynthesis
MATFNEPPAYITQSIQSILNQTLNDFELLLIDDSTNLETVSTIDSLVQSDARIKLIRASQRLGFVPALNMGLRQAKGEYIARMDGDDISVPERFELQISFLKTHPDIAVIGGAMDIINENNEKISHRDYATNPFKMKIYSLFRCPVAHPTVMMHRSIVEQGFCYDEFFLKAEDLELWLRLIKNGYKIINMPNTVLRFRVIENLSDKRTKDHFIYACNARTKNFSWKSIVYSLISILISKIYVMLPKKIIHIVYEKENSKKKIFSYH